MAIRKTSLPDGSLIEKVFPVIHYRDAYRSEVHAAGILAPEDVFKAFFRSAPAWISSLLALRNRIVRAFGLKAPAPEKNREEKLRDLKVEPGEAVGLFHVFSKTGREVLAGEDDKHLDFRVSFFLDPPESPGGPYGFTLSTAVQIKNRLGRLYFGMVKPFHRLIVPAIMRSMIRALEGPSIPTGPAHVLDSRNP